MHNIYKAINPKILFFSTIACFPSLLMQDNIFYLWAIIAMFVVLLKVKKGKVNFLPSFILLFSVVFFNQLTPSGKIFFTWGNFRFTQGALVFGLKKAGVLLGMVFISQYAISKNLQIKGKIGTFISRMFYFFDRLSEHKEQFNFKKPIESIDSILIEVYASPEEYSTSLESNETTFIHWLICLTPVLISYFLLFV